VNKIRGTWHKVRGTMRSNALALLLDGLFSSVVLTHFIVDLINSQRAVLLTYMSVPLGLSNAALGFFNTMYVVAGSIIQPLFGYLADRLGPRWMAMGGVLWLGGFFGLALVIPGQAALWLLIIASIGSAAFHPAGVMQATLRGQTHFSGRETTSAAFFFVFGQTGFFIGPLLGGPLLDRFGPMGLLLLVSMVVPTGLNVGYRLRRAPMAAPAVGAARTVNDSEGAGPQLAGWQPGRLLPLVAFALVAAFQAWAQQNMMTFVPKYIHDLGQTPSVYGVMTALFMGGSALGNGFGGGLADRFGKRRVATLALSLASVPLFLVGSVGWSGWLLLFIPLGGALTGAVQSIIVVLAQRFLPKGMALASGLILGFMFSAGALGTMLSGFLADRWGLATIFHMNALIVLAAAGLAFTLAKN
jgi:FSR family fosmidomycin resistance protein-like MFS transporter